MRDLATVVMARCNLRQAHTFLYQSGSHQCYHQQKHNRNHQEPSLVLPASRLAGATGYLQCITMIRSSLIHVHSCITRACNGFHADAHLAEAAASAIKGAPRAICKAHLRASFTIVTPPPWSGVISPQLTSVLKIVCGWKLKVRSVSFIRHVSFPHDISITVDTCLSSNPVVKLSMFWS